MRWVVFVLCCLLACCCAAGADTAEASVARAPGCLSVVVDPSYGSVLPTPTAIITITFSGTAGYNTGSGVPQAFNGGSIASIQSNMVTDTAVFLITDTGARVNITSALIINATSFSVTFNGLSAVRTYTLFVRGDRFYSFNGLRESMDFFGYGSYPPVATSPQTLPVPSFCTTAVYSSNWWNVPLTPVVNSASVTTASACNGPVSSFNDPNHCNFTLDTTLSVSNASVVSVSTFVYSSNTYTLSTPLTGFLAMLLASRLSRYPLFHCYNCCVASCWWF
eukprot:gnl/Hemi2/19183_TR6371_c1_g1_i1.p1 gnl/Hemi2/19183_TR6371_c1_g1~~gnl/Hemi2/19183_TR6371_c1_g1_i1.p1  ORF type:complete len:278 (-),score=-16.26 gnl/Hemi2/19183_TR6371_c1_g1_i1:155-988(-)